MRRQEHRAAGTKKARTIDTGNRHCREMDEALEANPPQITWRKNSHGVMVAVSVNDPHAEGRGTESRQRYAYTLEAESMAAEQQAREVADRFRRHHAENTPLMIAARTEI